MISWNAENCFRARIFHEFELNLLGYFIVFEGTLSISLEIVWYFLAKIYNFLDFFQTKEGTKYFSREGSHVPVWWTREWKIKVRRAGSFFGTKKVEYCTKHLHQKICSTCLTSGQQIMTWDFFVKLWDITKKKLWCHRFTDIE